MIEERTVDYVLQWILATYGNQNNFSKIGFVLDWLTAAMECDCVDMAALDFGYELFYSMLTYEALTPHVMKLVYTLTKSSDVTRRRVTELFDYAKKREGKRNMLRPLQAILGLLKSYKPECVPEDVPAISIHTAFKKLNASLVSKFRNCQVRRNHMSKDIQNLMWTNPINAINGRNEKADPLVPNMEFFNIGAKQYANKEPTKNYLDFSDPVSLVQYSLQHAMCRPARLRALLSNDTGVMLLAVASHAEHSFLSHDLHHLLNTCFLDVSPHSYLEKQYLLHRLARLQRSLLQGIPVTTRFLAQYLPLWNERDYFTEILELVEWVSADCPDYIDYIVGPLTRVYHRAQPLEQCAVLKSLTNMYTNLVYTSRRIRQHFLGARPPEVNYSLVLSKLASEISDMCGKGVQANPDDMRVLFSSTWSAECQSEAEFLYEVPLGALPTKLTLYLPLLSMSATLIDKMAALMMVYRELFRRMKSKMKQRDETYSRHMKSLQSYTGHMLSWLYLSQAVADHLPLPLADQLRNTIPQLDEILSIKNHVAFSPYTYALLNTGDDRDGTNKLWYDAVLKQEFPNLNMFFKNSVPELRG